ncbi:MULTISPECIES: O-antigen ligase family protein [unclassified Candidatus Frackibacter]|uniref:O-antigen ligase family protein n=1 Tax=unclassified Candidatus Frackibacter TaxID=2648818 RepID=UPI00088F455E|nr:MULTISPECIES: O-antigen ligase family protein [unclassified Candidatus Frackibacter]SDC08599.1 O-antigen ligase [Candidatus Frackibacter sp. WG11]SEM38215.1 O-antigen ligase [Candidatus Frackibacter sp. WG12]SFL43768.1 O-antigen ligase [Candidatus Frackibacter sp. WG13]
MFENKLICFGLILYALMIAISTAGSNIGLGLVFIGLVIKLIKEREGLKYLKTGMELSILLYLLANLISILFSHNMNISWQAFGEVIIPVLIYYMIFNSVTRLELVKKIFIFFILSISIASIYSIYQHYFLEIERASGFFLTLTYGSIMVLILPLLITFNFNDLSMKNRLLSLITLGITSLSLIFTNTRGTWLAILGGVAFLSIFKNKKLIIWFMVLVILALALIPSFYQRASTIIDLDNSSNKERLLMWKSAFNMFRDYPLTGVGLGMFSELYPKKYMLPEARVKKRHYAHNIVMNILAETGIIGLGAFTFLVSYIFKVGFELLRNLEDKYWINAILGLLAGILAFLIHGLTFYNLGDSETAKLFWVIIALLMVIYREKQNKQSKVVA